MSGTKTTQSRAWEDSIIVHGDGNAESGWYITVAGGAESFRFITWICLPILGLFGGGHASHHDRCVPCG